MVSVPKRNVVNLFKSLKKEQLDFDSQAFVCFRVCFLLCLQELKTSSLEFNVASCGLYIIQYFSRRQSLQTPVTGLKPFALPKTFQLNSYGICASFRNQMYLLSIVLFIFFFFLKSELCPYHLCLNVLSVRPVYVSHVKSSSLVT